MKRIAATLLALLILVLPAFAGGEDSVPSPDEFVPEIMSDAYVSDTNYAVAFMSLYDGETWFHNEESYFEVASVYKLPLNMYYYELEASGELDEDSLVAGMPLDVCHYNSLELSSNPVSEAMYERLGGYTAFKRLVLPYTGYTEDELMPEYYNENAFTARMVLNILDYVWENQDTFSELIAHMLAAQPGEYLEGGTLDCEIAQKYGYDTYDGTLHVAVAGIVYAEEPFLIAILTRTSYGAIDAMGRLCDAFAAWDAARIAALKAQAEDEPSPTPDVDVQQPPGLYEPLAMDIAGAVCSISPLPAELPWSEIFRVLYG